MLTTTNRTKTRTRRPHQQGATGATGRDLTTVDLADLFTPPGPYCRPIQLRPAGRNRSHADASPAWWGQGARPRLGPAKRWGGEARPLPGHTAGDTTASLTHCRGLVRFADTRHGTRPLLGHTKRGQDRFLDTRKDVHDAGEREHSRLDLAVLDQIHEVHHAHRRLALLPIHRA